MAINKSSLDTSCLSQILSYPDCPTMRVIPIHFPPDEDPSYELIGSTSQPSPSALRSPNPSAPTSCEAVPFHDLCALQASEAPRR